MNLTGSENLTHRTCWVFDMDGTLTLQIGILTHNGKDIAHGTLNACGLMVFFEPTLVLSRDCHAPKPEPDGIFALLNTWEAAPTEAVMVGDYKFDLMAGQQADTATVYIDTAGEFVWSEYADYGVRSLKAVVDWLGVNTSHEL